MKICIHDTPLRQKYLKK